MEIKILCDTHSVLSSFIREMRDKEIQKDSLRFRNNLTRAGEVMAYEISKTLQYKGVEVSTPLGKAQANIPADKIVLATVFRAGLPFHAGMLNYFDAAENAFVSAFRNHHPDGSFEVVVEYLASPSVEGKVLIIADPMLASGSSIELVHKALMQRGKPKKLIVAAVMSSRKGIDHLQKVLPEDTCIWSAALDNELTKDSYIYPGLGDAGDLAFGEKL